MVENLPANAGDSRDSGSTPGLGDALIDQCSLIITGIRGM